MRVPWLPHVMFLPLSSMLYDLKWKIILRSLGTVISQVQKPSSRLDNWPESSVRSLWPSLQTRSKKKKDNASVITWASHLHQRERLRDQAYFVKEVNLISTPYLKRHCLKFLNATYRVLRILVCTRTGRKIKEILPGQGESTNILLVSLSKILSG